MSGSERTARDDQPPGPERPAIRELPPEVAARLAAGEVVERPGSVVKELVENALDAGAGRIAIELEGGGLERIAVSDDGVGMRAAEVELAFRRHATSKIQSDADLAAVQTLGFRGEALPSIAAVARVTCLTRHVAEAVGTRLVLVGGAVVERRAVGRPVGTTVAVEELFAAVPARRKFLRSKSAETAHALGIVEHLALAYPEVAFTVRSDGREALRTPGTGRAEDALLAVYGLETARDLLPLEPVELYAAGESDGAVVVRVQGFAGQGGAHRASRSGQSFFVNRRWVQSRAIAQAVDEAYRDLAPTGRYPIVLLDITVPPEEVDVNVHPAKSEVKLLRERAVYAAVLRAIRQTLRAAPLPAWGGPDDAPGPSGGGAFPQFAELRVLGQVSATYIIAEGAAGLYLVDQHAAHERVLLEELRAGPAGPGAQGLLEPAVLELAPRQAAALREHLGALRQLGFDLEPFGAASVLVRAVPTALQRRDALGALGEALDALGDERAAPGWPERVAFVLACKTAVRAGDALTTEEMRALLVRLGEAELCRTCAHGRPTALLLSHSQLAREFGRR